MNREQFVQVPAGGRSKGGMARRGIDLMPRDVQERVRQTLDGLAAKISSSG